MIHGLLMKAKNDELFVLDERIEPISYIDSKKWLGSMNSEMDSMYTNQVSTLIDPPEEIKLIGFS